jgi:ParB-like chromosome segregation protein Spo0J
MKIKQRIVPLEDLIPYEHNHRVITQKAIDAAKTSIENYGFNVPILIDKNNVIIAGHTRRLALIELGWDEVLCAEVQEVNEEKKDKIRLLDNAIGSSSKFDDIKLGRELRSIQDTSTDESWNTFAEVFKDDSVLTNLLKTSLGGALKPVTKETLEKAKQKQETKFGNKESNNDNEAIVQCPKCSRDFKIRVY